jgi:hypothetical protein
LVGCHACSNGERLFKNDEDNSSLN